MNDEKEEGAEPVLAPEKQKRGFAIMDPKLVRQIAQKGGRAAHEKGTAHQFTSEEARAAGKRGGAATHKAKKPNE